MKLFGSRVSDVCDAVRDHETRLAALERQTSDVAQIRAWRDRRRDLWLTKLLPTASAIIIAVLGLNAALHWF